MTRVPAAAMNRQHIDAIYADYHATVQKLREQELAAEERHRRELEAWNECEERLIALWQRQGAVLH